MRILQLIGYVVTYLVYKEIYSSSVERKLTIRSWEFQGLNNFHDLVFRVDFLSLPSFEQASPPDPPPITMRSYSDESKSTKKS